VTGIIHSVTTRAVSSGGERFVDTEEVVGSSPTPPTISLSAFAVIANRRLHIDKLLFFLCDREYGTCGISEIKSFSAYISNGHGDERGRWGNSRLRKNVRPSTIVTNYPNLRTTFRYFISKGFIEK
jgi:hypothetical protein